MKPACPIPYRYVVTRCGVTARHQDPVARQELHLRMRLAGGTSDLVGGGDAADA
jgi:hypothetical protein